MSLTPQRNDVEAVLDKNTIYTKFAPDEKSKLVYLMIKRTIDIICALVGLLVLAPFFLIVAILIKLEDPKGSIFYQTRIGKNENHSGCISFALWFQMPKNF